jgi:hypothetical protein
LIRRTRVPVKDFGFFFIKTSSEFLLYCLMPSTLAEGGIRFVFPFYGLGRGFPGNVPELQNFDEMLASPSL